MGETKPEEEKQESKKAAKKDAKKAEKAAKKAERKSLSAQSDPVAEGGILLFYNIEKYWL